MNSSPVSSRRNAEYELQFRSLFHENHALSFPCDAAGHVDMDTLSDRARNNYLFARVATRRAFSGPAVQSKERS